MVFRVADTATLDKVKDRRQDRVRGRPRQRGMTMTKIGKAPMFCKLLIAGFACGFLTLTGCDSSGQYFRSSAEICRDYGYQPSSSGYRECMRRRARSPIRKI
jgi:hypothetical protein